MKKVSCLNWLFGMMVWVGVGVKDEGIGGRVEHGKEKSAASRFGHTFVSGFPGLYIRVFDY